MMTEESRRPGPYHYIDQGEKSPTVKTYELKHIRPRHREIARRLVLGESVKQISIDLGMSAHALYLITNSDLFKLELKRLEEQRELETVNIAHQLEEIAPQALDTLEKTMHTADDDKLRVSCAKDLLDRAGYGAVQKNVNVNIDTSNLSLEAKRKLLAERIQKAKTDAEDKAAKLREAQEIEVEWEEVDPSDEDDGDSKISIATI